MVLCFAFKSVIHFVSIFSVNCEVWSVGQRSLFLAYGCLIAPAPFVKRLYFLHWIAFVAVSKLSWLICVMSISHSLFRSLISISPSTNARLSWLLWPYSKSQHHEQWFLPFFDVVVVVEIVLGILAPLPFHTNLELAYLCLCNICWAFVIHDLNLSINMWKICIFPKSGLSIYECNVCLFRFSLILFTNI